MYDAVMSLVGRLCCVPTVSPSAPVVFFCFLGFDKHAWAWASACAHFRAHGMVLGSAFRHKTVGPNNCVGPNRRRSMAVAGLGCMHGGTDDIKNQLYFKSVRWQTVYEMKVRNHVPLGKGPMLHAAR